MRPIRSWNIVATNIKKWISRELRMLAYAFPIELMFSIAPLLFLNTEDEPIRLFIQTDNSPFPVKVENAEKMGEGTN
jgi:hypothetical protein